MPTRLAFAILLGSVLAGWAEGAQVVMEHERWANTDEAFAKFEARIESRHDRNLLARRHVRVAEATHVYGEHVRMLTDGEAGVRGYDGQCD